MAEQVGLHKVGTMYTERWMEQVEEEVVDEELEEVVEEEVEEEELVEELEENMVTEVQNVGDHLSTVPIVQ